MSIYGNYRTRTFGQIFPDLTTFKNFFTGCPIPNRLLTGTPYANYTIDAIYALLVSEFFGAHIAHSSEDWFKLRVMQIIFEYGPTWQREMVLQDKLMNATDADLRAGAYSLHNHALHPSTSPSTGTDEELTYIDDQNVNKWKKDYVRSFTDGSAALDDSATRRFINHFKKLFIKFIVPDGNIYYEEEEE